MSQVPHSFQMGNLSGIDMILSIETLILFFSFQKIEFVLLFFFCYFFVCVDFCFVGKV